MSDEGFCGKGGKKGFGLVLRSSMERVCECECECECE